MKAGGWLKVQNGRNDLTVGGEVALDRWGKGRGGEAKEMGTLLNYLQHGSKTSDKPVQKHSRKMQENSDQKVN